MNFDHLQKSKEKKTTKFHKNGHLELLNFLWLHWNILLLNWLTNLKSMEYITEYYVFNYELVTVYEKFHIMKSSPTRTLLEL